jgi:hypothetical protein
MRIFYASNSSANATGLSGSLAWHYNLYLPLVDLGHEVVQFEYDMDPHFRNLDPSVPEERAFISARRPLLEEELLRQVRAAHREKPVDLFFSYFYSAIARPGVIREIGSLGIVTVNWYCNGAHQFHLVEEIAPAYEYCLVPEKFRLEDYRRIGARPIYCQEAANPNVYRPYALPVEYDAVFVGQCYGDRPEILGYLWDHRIEAHVWGPGWAARENASAAGRPEQCSFRARLARWTGIRKRSGKDRFHGANPNFRHPPVSDEEMIRLYSKGRIVLGFSSCGETHRGGERILQVRLRDFEVPMSGGFYLVEHVEELEEFFEPMKEIVFYHDRHDLLDKIRYYLAHESEREEIRRAGHRRARRDHTWHRRFEGAFRQMELPR